jgi:prepilin-type processing-associated H-X9-DG protein
MRRKLIPVLVLALAGGLLWWTSWRGESPLHDVESDVSRCREQLRSIFAGLVEYEKRHGEAPQLSGGDFLGSLIQSGVWPDEAESHRLLLCPGPNALVSPMGLGSPNWKTSYTVSDFGAQELAAFPAGGTQLRAIVACRTSTKMSHFGALNVLFTDGSVKTLQLGKLIQSAKLPASSLLIPMGLESPLEELKLLISE